MAQQKRFQLGTKRLWVRSLALLSGLRSSIAMSCGVGWRWGSDSTLLWLWHRPAATALIGPLAWEPPYAAGVALKSKKKKKKKKSSLYNLDATPFFRCVFCEHFLPVCGFSSHSLDIVFCKAEVFNFILLLLLVSGHTRGMQKFLGQGSKPSYSSDNAKSLTARPPGNSQKFSIWMKSSWSIVYFMDHAFSVVSRSKVIQIFSYVVFLRV